MKILAVASLLSLADAHFTTGHFLVNGTDTGLWKHVLKVGIFGNPATNGGFPPDNHFAQIVPQYSSDGWHNPNLTCGRLAFAAVKDTAVADVIAGEEIGFRVMSDLEIDPRHNGGVMYGKFFHQGPAQVYLSRAPNDDLMSYRGDGDWFKVAYQGPLNDTDWLLWGKQEYNFTLPRTTPPGKYLMRFAYFMPTSEKGYAQFFPNCALINVIGPGGGTPGPFVKIPGHYNEEDPGFWLPFNQEYGRLPADQMRMSEYKPPGPPVWKG